MGSAEKGQARKCKNEKGRRQRGAATREFRLTGSTELRRPRPSLPPSRAHCAGAFHSPGPLPGAARGASGAFVWSERKQPPRSNESALLGTPRSPHSSPAPLLRCAPRTPHCCALESALLRSALFCSAAAPPPPFPRSSSLPSPPAFPESIWGHCQPCGGRPRARRHCCRPRNRVRCHTGWGVRLGGAPGSRNGSISRQPIDFCCCTGGIRCPAAEWVFGAVVLLLPPGTEFVSPSNLFWGGLFGIGFVGDAEEWHGEW